ncbi:anti-sigma regulatory factor [Adhaeribacter pallidiroseus]|uniref:Non-specific serine/threonine protein kinase n=1 Tax=Adhaeribacter pallidiroseus TaxID=2072847 RepID=A0A369Q965_9BACT|nr:anti-sigma regulatory factor [Adhaeribacter pallidiroseus]RDC58828.1 Non-specific serine/threonine protein kinase [Adhaeribacter pallidiroseus]
MMTLSKENFEIKREPDVILYRNRAKELAAKIGMSLVGQTKLITAASELVRNMLRYAEGGTGTIEVVVRNNIKGIRLTFADKGPGIKDLKLAMQDGFSTGRSLGLGLPGAKRLSNEFDIKSEPGKGTTVTIIRWKNGL